MRLNKYIAQAGICSRRKADQLIADGQVKLNGQIVRELGVIIDEKKDEVLVAEKLLTLGSDKIYLAMNKPVGYITSTSSAQGISVMELARGYGRIFPIGRLDRETSGLLLLTNDGDFAYNLTHAKFGHEKEYEVVFENKLKPSDIKAFERGLELDDKKLQPVKVVGYKGNRATLILREGVNRQIRRMGQKRDNEVVSLKRVRIDKLKLGNLPEGEIREIKPSDVI